MIDAKAAPDHACQGKGGEEGKDVEILLIGRNTAGASSIEQNNSYAGKPSQDSQYCAHQTSDKDAKSIAILFGPGRLPPTSRGISVPIIAVVPVIPIVIVAVVWVTGCIIARYPLRIGRWIHLVWWWLRWHWIASLWRIRRTLWKRRLIHRRRRLYRHKLTI